MLPQGPATRIIMPPNVEILAFLASFRAILAVFLALFPLGAIWGPFGVFLGPFGPFLALWVPLWPFGSGGKPPPPRVASSRVRSDLVFWVAARGSKSGFTGPKLGRSVKYGFEGSQVHSQKNYRRTHSGEGGPGIHPVGRVPQKLLRLRRDV